TARAGRAERRPPAAVPGLRGAGGRRPGHGEPVGRGDVRLGRGRPRAGGRGVERRPAGGAVRADRRERRVGGQSGRGVGLRLDRPATVILPSAASSVSTWVGGSPGWSAKKRNSPT